MDLNIETPFGICDKTGWVHGYFCNGVNDIEAEYGAEITDLIDYDIDMSGVGKFRPKSLHGIENNNGWIKTESEKDLPKVGDYDMSTLKLMYWTNGGQYEANDYKKWKLHYPHLEISHYQFIPIIKLNEPLY